MIASKSIAGEDPVLNPNFWLWVKESDRAEVGWELPNSENFFVEGQTIIEPRKWYHIAGVRSANRNSLHIYVNGFEDVPPSTTFGAPNTQDISVYFGDTPGVPNERYHGLIDEVRIWRTARSALEIQSTMNVSLTGNETAHVGYGRLNEGEGQIVHDLSTTINHGHLGDTQGVDSSDPTWLVPSPIATAQ